METRDPLRCPECNGTGEIECGYANPHDPADRDTWTERCTADFCAQGTLACSRCPEAPDAVRMIDNEPVCPACYGEVTGDCSSCGGEGFLERGDRSNGHTLEAYATSCEDCCGRGKYLPAKELAA